MTFGPSFSFSAAAAAALLLVAAAAPVHALSSSSRSVAVSAPSSAPSSSASASASWGAPAKTQLRGFVAASENPNSQSSILVNLDASSGAEAPVGSSGPVTHDGGFLTNEMAVFDQAASQSPLALSVVINVSTVQNFVVGTDWDAGAQVFRVGPTPGPVLSIEADNDLRKVFATVFVGPALHFAEFDVLRREIVPKFEIGVKMLQLPGASTYCPRGHRYFAMVDGPQGVQLKVIDVQKMKVVASPLVLGGAEACNFEWDWVLGKMYMMYSAGSNSTALVEIDIETGKIVKNIATVDGLPACAGASTFDVATGIYYADLQPTSQDSDVLVGIDVAKGTVVSRAPLKHQITTMQVVAQHP